MSSKYIFYMIVSLCVSFTLAQTNTISDDRMLLVLKPVSPKNVYYKDYFSKLVEFYIQYFNSVKGNDNIILIIDKDSLDWYKGKIPDDALLIEDTVDDIWVRDFGLAHPSKPTQFYYQAEYIKPSTVGPQTQKTLTNILEKYKISYKKIQLISDGGNYVDNNKNMAVMTNKFITDNSKKTQEEIKKELMTLIGLDYLAIVEREENDLLAHSDGMVSFIEENTIVVNKYEEPYRTKVLNSLKTDLSKDIKIVEVVNGSNSKKYDGYSSAEGIYVNSVVTKKFIYMPTFAKTIDDVAFKTIQDNTTKKVIKIPAENVAFMGGSVRCLSFQLEGENAKILINAAQQKVSASTTGRSLSVEMFMIMFLIFIIN